MDLKLLTTIWTILIILNVPVHGSPLNKNRRHRNEKTTLSYPDFLDERIWGEPCGQESNASLTSQASQATQETGSVNVRCQVAMSLEDSSRPAFQKLRNKKRSISVIDMPKWILNEDNYTFLPLFDPMAINNSSSLQSPVSVSLLKKKRVKNCRIGHNQLRKIYKDLEIFVASFVYLHKISLYHNNNHSTSHTEDILQMKQISRLLLCEVKTVIGRIRTMQPNKITSVHEMKHILKFSNNYSEHDIDMVDLKYSKLKFLSYARDLGTFMNAKYEIAVRMQNNINAARKSGLAKHRKSKQNQSTKDQQQNGSKSRNKKRHPKNKKRIRSNLKQNINI